MPKQVDIPFQPEAKEPMLSGRKRATTRTKRFGYPGDWFIAFGRTFVLTEVQRTFLDVVVRHFYNEDGFDSPHAFVQYWNRLHPTVTYAKRSGRVVFFHRFTPRDEESPVGASIPKTPRAAYDQVERKA